MSFNFRLSIIAFSIAAPLSAVAATAGSTLAPYYVGPGQATEIAFHPIDGGHKAIIGAIYTPVNSQAEPSFSEVKRALLLHRGGYEGTLREETPGHYLFILGSPARPQSYCIHSVTVKPDGGIMIQQPKLQNGCVYYHGASWSYSSPIPTPIMPYHVAK